MIPVADVVAWRAHLAARALGEAHPDLPQRVAAIEPGLHERAQDALRIAHLQELVAAAGTPTARAALRVLMPAYLDAAVAELDGGCRRRRRAALAPWGGDVDAVLASEPDGLRRAAIELDYRRAEERLAAGAAERDAARDACARAIGCADARAALQLADEPRSAGEADEVERGFVTPCDDEVASAVLDRWRRLHTTGDAPRACDVPRIAWQPDRQQSLPEPGCVSFLRRTLTALRFDPDTAGARIERVANAPAAPELWAEVGPRAVVVAGHWGGPYGCALVSERAGRAAHITFVREARGPEAAAGADPTHGFAAGWLFRRIASAPAGPLAATDPDGDGRAAQRLEDLIDVRRAFIAIAGEPSRAFRAAGRPPAPGESPPEGGWPRLRGAMFAALVEERLMSRFGRAWFDAPPAGAYLRELWASGPDGTPESMASAWGLGTMDSSPLLEAFRLRKGREF